MVKINNYFKSFRPFKNMLLSAIEVSKQQYYSRVWHEDLPHKLKENGISGKLLNTVKVFIYINESKELF